MELFAGLGLIKTVFSWLSGIDVKSVANAVAQGYEAKAKAAADTTIATVQAGRDVSAAQVGAARDVEVNRDRTDAEIAAEMIRADLRRNEIQGAADTADRSDWKMSWVRPTLCAIAIWYFGAWVGWATGMIEHKPDLLPDPLMWLAVGIIGSIFALRSIFEKPAQTEARKSIVQTTIETQQKPAPATGGRKP